MIFYICNRKIRDDVANAKIAQLVEHDLAKVGVAGSSPVFRSKTGEKPVPKNFGKFSFSLKDWIKKRDFEVSFFHYAQVVELVDTQG